MLDVSLSRSIYIRLCPPLRLLRVLHHASVAELPLTPPVLVNPTATYQRGCHRDATDDAADGRVR